MKKFREFILFISDIFHNKEIIKKLAYNDFKAKYINSVLGIVWAFVQPTITILVFWFVFQVGFKTAPIEDSPFILWLLCGLIPWFYYAEAINNATNSIIEYSYLVKKVVFRVSILPIVKIISSLFVHIFFIVVIFIMFIIYGYNINIYNIQIIYYLFATIILVLGISFITSALSVFIKDINQFVAVLIQIGFWYTPIFWNFDMIEEKYKIIFIINPMFYIIQGYRDSFINRIWFFERIEYTIYFWIITIFLFVFGAIIFRKLRPHFSDVL